MAEKNARAIYKEKIEYARFSEECLSKSDIWVIALPSDEFKKLDYKKYAKNSTIIVDCWRILNPRNFPAGVKYIKWGYYNG